MRLVNWEERLVSVNDEECDVYICATFVDESPIERIYLTIAV